MKIEAAFVGLIHYKQRLSSPRTAFNKMEKVKGCGKKVAEAGKTEKSKLDEIRTKSE